MEGEGGRLARDWPQRGDPPEGRRGPGSAGGPAPPGLQEPGGGAGGGLGSFKGWFT
jgi:hypothetical protein